MDWKELKMILEEIARERGINFEKVLDCFESALGVAYRKDYGKKEQKIKAKVDLEKGETEFYQIKLVVDENYLKENNLKFNEEKHIFLEDAKEIDPTIQVGQEIKFLLEKKTDFGRIAAQSAMQVLLQRLKETERETIYEEFKKKEGEIVSGIVQRVESKNVIFDLGKTLAILPKEEQIPNEFYRPGQRLKAYLLSVEMIKKGPHLILSRAFPKFVTKLFELEVPEIAQGQVKIVSIAREPGLRTKIAVHSLDPKIDAIGAVVGHRGSRINSVVSELGGEKIDVILYSEDPKEYIANALSPAKVLEVKIGEKNTALAIVPKDQLSLAIGKDGQNVRLAVKLTGWKIDVKSIEEAENGLSHSNNN